MTPEAKPADIREPNLDDRLARLLETTPRGHCLTLPSPRWSRWARVGGEER